MMDDPVRIAVRSRTLKEPETAEGRVMQSVTDNLFKMPRLVSMVREIIKGRSDSPHIEGTLHLAKQIFEVPRLQEIQDFFADLTTTSLSRLNPCGRIIEYNDDETFGAAIFYNLWRIMVCGTIQRLSSYDDPGLLAQYFELHAVEREDISAASSISMSTHFALQMPLGPPLNALRISSPLMVSFGAWKRLELRQSSPTSRHSLRAQEMQRYVQESYVKALGMWGIDAPNKRQMEIVCHAFSAGPPFDGAQSDNKEK